ncbi:MAG: hypothetical protein ACYTJ0_01315 [Planctomycetota bacterium]|jgi:hypothetical protein
MRLLPIATLLFTVLALSGQQEPPQQPQLPPGHPPMQPSLPSGHPPVTGTRAAPSTGPVDAALADVASVDALLGSYYGAISGAAGEPRDWDRFRSLFLPGARMITARPMGVRAVPMALTPEDYVKANDSYFSSGGYFEREVHREMDAYGMIAQVFSTYESRRKADAAEPYSRGINSFQLLFDGQRWWIVSMTWDFERPADNPLPAEYLPG